MDGGYLYERKLDLEEAPASDRTLSRKEYGEHSPPNQAALPTVLGGGCHQREPGLGPLMRVTGLWGAHMGPEEPLSS